MQHVWKNGLSRQEATAEAAAEWGAEVERLYGILLMRKAQSWFTGYNSNVEGHEQGTKRYMVYNGGTPRFRRTIKDVAEQDYRGIELR
jgi:hypothetical protein